MNEPTIPTLLISGTIGAGKTAIAADVGEVLEERGLCAAVIDLDWLGWLCRPSDKSGPSVDDLIAENLAVVWPNFISAGVERFVLARVIQTKSQIDLLKRVVPEADMTVALIESPSELVAKRLSARDSGAVLEEHLVETKHFAAVLESSGVESVRITNDERPLRDVSLELLTSIGWL